MLRRTSAVAVMATVFGGWLGQAPALADQSPATHPAGATSPTEQGSTAPAVWPKPQSLRAQGDFARVTPRVTLVTDPADNPDPYALDVVEDALRAAGAGTVTRAHTPGPGLAVYLGTAAAGPLAGLGAPATGDL